MKKIAIIAFAGFIGLTSCVSKKKYTALETQNTQTEGELSTAKMELASCLDKQKASKTEVDYLKSVNYKLLESNSSLSTLSAQESANLEKSLESLSQKERQVKSLQSALNKKDSVMFALVSSLKGEFIAADDEDIQIEVENLDQLKKFLELGFKNILLDNFNIKNLINFDFQENILKNIEHSNTKGFEIRYLWENKSINGRLLFRYQDPKDETGLQLLRRSKKSLSLFNWY